MILRFNCQRAAAIALACLIGGVAVSCTTSRVHSDFDPQADFSNYSTFSWISDAPLIRPAGQDDIYVSPLDLQRIRSAIRSELTAKGYQYLDDNRNVDFVVSFTVGSRDKIDVDSYPMPYRGSWRWPYYGDTLRVHSYTEGILAIDIFDGELRRPVWHGLARKRISGSNPEKTGRLIQNEIAGILSEFPPP